MPIRDVRKVGYNARRAMSSANEEEGKLSRSMEIAQQWLVSSFNKLQVQLKYY